MPRRIFNNTVIVRKDDDGPTTAEHAKRIAVEYVKQKEVITTALGAVVRLYDHICIVSCEDHCLYYKVIVETSKEVD